MAAEVGDSNYVERSSNMVTLDSSTVQASKLPGGSTSGETGQLPVIDETKPCDIMDVDADHVGHSKEDEKWRVFNSPDSESPRRKRCVKEKLKGLADKYVSCLQAVDNAADMRGFDGGGGPAVVHGPHQPFQSTSTNPASE